MIAYAEFNEFLTVGYFYMALKCYYCHLVEYLGSHRIILTPSDEKNINESIITG